MSSQEIIEKYQNSVVQIATETGTGTGFYLPAYDLIITNNHVIKGDRKVTIKSRTFDKTLAEVIFIDEKYDMAFILPPVDMKALPDLQLGDSDLMKEGDDVIAIGHPYGLNYTATQGVISRVNRIQQGLKYIQIDAAINPGNSGGPLINNAGQVIGINTFIVRGGDNLGFALPANYLKEALEQYLKIKGTFAIRCPSCSTLVTEQNIESEKYCPNCGTVINFPKEVTKQTAPATGVVKLIEDILEQLGFNKELAKSGYNYWEVENGTAKIKISYNPDNYFIISHAFLAQIPKDGIKELYSFILRENYKLKGKFFSLYEGNVILSCVIYDLDINLESGQVIFKDLFEKANYYDIILIDQYNCLPVLEEQ